METKRSFCELSPARATHEKKLRAEFVLVVMIALLAIPARAAG